MREVKFSSSHLFSFCALAWEYFLKLLNLSKYVRLILDFIMIIFYCFEKLKICLCVVEELFKKLRMLYIFFSVVISDKPYICTGIAGKITISEMSEIRVSFYHLFL